VMGAALTKRRQSRSDSPDQQQLDRFCIQRFANEGKEGPCFHWRCGNTQRGFNNDGHACPRNQRPVLIYSAHPALSVTTCTTHCFTASPLLPTSPVPNHILCKYCFCLCCSHLTFKLLAGEGFWGLQPASLTPATPRLSDRIG